MSYRGRFAPSPTGHLHFGSLVAAVGSWLCAKHAGGQWLVRMEDIDPPREVPGSAASILAALPAFGLVADDAALFQSCTAGAYDAAFEQLRATDRVFPCWCSRSDLAASGGMHRDGRCVAAPDPAEPPAWRLRVPDIEIAFDDALQGPQRQNLRDTGGRFRDPPGRGLLCLPAGLRGGRCVPGHHRGGPRPRPARLHRAPDLAAALPGAAYARATGTCRWYWTPTARKLSKSEQAWPVDPADPLPALRRALAFLQSADTRRGHATSTDLLAQRADRFRPGTFAALQRSICASEPL